MVAKSTWKLSEEHHKLAEEYYYLVPKFVNILAKEFYTNKDDVRSCIHEALTRASYRWDKSLGVPFKAYFFKACRRAVIRMLFQGKPEIKCNSINSPYSEGMTVEDLIGEEDSNIGKELPAIFSTTEIKIASPNGKVWIVNTKSNGLDRFKVTEKVWKMLFKRHVQEKTFEEIAKEMKTSRQNIQQQLYRFYQEMRLRFGEES